MQFPRCDPEAVENESGDVEFKAQFDPTSRQDWCELIKDIVAMANSGGGTILIGVNDDGSSSGQNVAPVLLLDPADVTNKIHSYTEEQFSAFEICEATRRGRTIALIRVGSTRIPIVFTSPGTYAVGPSTQKTAFGRGTLYSRHGPKSEPATSADLAAALERELERVKRFWLSGLAQVVAAPPGAIVQVVTDHVGAKESPEGIPVRLAGEHDARMFRAIRVDKLYPYRQTELLRKLRELLGTAAIGAHDLLCVRRVHATDENPNFSHKAQWSPRQYSEAFVDWLIAQHSADEAFFQKARDAYRGLWSGPGAHRAGDR